MFSIGLKQEQQPITAYYSSSEDEQPQKDVKLNPFNLQPYQQIKDSQEDPNRKSASDQNNNQQRFPSGNHTNTQISASDSTLADKIQIDSSYRQIQTQSQQGQNLKNKDLYQDRQGQSQYSRRPKTQNQQQNQQNTFRHQDDRSIQSNNSRGFDIQTNHNDNQHAFGTQNNQHQRYIHPLHNDNIQQNNHNLKHNFTNSNSNSNRLNQNGNGYTFQKNLKNEGGAQQSYNNQKHNHRFPQNGQKFYQDNQAQKNRDQQLNANNFNNIPIQNQNKTYFDRSGDRAQFVPQKRKNSFHQNQEQFNVNDNYTYQYDNKYFHDDIPQRPSRQRIEQQWPSTQPQTMNQDPQNLYPAQNFIQQQTVPHQFLNQNQQYLTDQSNLQLQQSQPTHTQPRYNSQQTNVQFIQPQAQQFQQGAYIQNTLPQNVNRVPFTPSQRDQANLGNQFTIRPPSSLQNPRSHQIPHMENQFRPDSDVSQKNYEQLFVPQSQQIQRSPRILPPNSGRPPQDIYNQPPQAQFQFSFNNQAPAFHQPRPPPLQQQSQIQPSNLQINQTGIFKQNAPQKQFGFQSQQNQIQVVQGSSQAQQYMGVPQLQVQSPNKPRIVIQPPQKQASNQIGNNNQKSRNQNFPQKRPFGFNPHHNNKFQQKGQNKKKEKAPKIPSMDNLAVKLPRNEQERKELSQWISERKKNFPTQENINRKNDKKQKLMEAGGIGSKQDRYEKLREILQVQKSMGLLKKAGSLELCNKLMSNSRKDRFNNRQGNRFQPKNNQHHYAKYANDIDKNGALSPKQHNKQMYTQYKKESEQQNQSHDQSQITTIQEDNNDQPTNTKQKQDNLYKAQHDQGYGQKSENKNDFGNYKQKNDRKNHEHFQVSRKYFKNINQPLSVSDKLQQIEERKNYNLVLQAFNFMVANKFFENGTQEKDLIYPEHIMPNKSGNISYQDQIYENMNKFILENGRIQQQMSDISSDE